MECLHVSLCGLLWKSIKHFISNNKRVGFEKKFFHFVPFAEESKVANVAIVLLLLKNSGREL